MAFAFPRDRRLLSSKDFRRVFQDAMKKQSNGVVLLARKKKQGTARLGIIVAKRDIPKAVRRNQCKRLIRETFRLSQPSLGNFDVIIMVKRPCRTLQKEELSNILNGLWGKLGSCHNTLLSS